MHDGARVLLCKHIHVGLNKCRPLVLWPELTGVGASWGGITLLARLFSMRYHCRSCCSPFSQNAREFFSSWLHSPLALSKLAQHFPLVGKHLQPTNKGGVLNNLVPVDAAIFGGGDARKDARMEEIDGRWVAGERAVAKDRGSVAGATRANWSQCFKGGDNFPIISSSK